MIYMHFLHLVSRTKRVVCHTSTQPPIAGTSIRCIPDGPKEVKYGLRHVKRHTQIAIETL